MISVQFDGIEQVLNALGQYEKDQRERAKLACVEIAQLLEAYAITHHRWVPRTWATNVTTHGTWTELADDLFEIVISANMWYDVYLETGAKQYETFLGLGSVVQTKWSWLWPAMLDNRQVILEVFARHLRH